MTVALITFLGSAILVAGWYAFFPAVIIACLGTFIGYIYVNCQLAIRRERSNAKAPIVGQVGAALSGLRKSMPLACFSIPRAHSVRLRQPAFVRMGPSSISARRSESKST